MPWNRTDPEPFDDRRRQLAEQERALAERRRQLMEQMHPNGQSATAKPAAPLVWRNEDDDAPVARATEPTPARKRHLARQRQRDRLVVIGLSILFLIVVGLMIWIAYVHNTATISGT